MVELIPRIQRVRGQLKAGVASIDELSQLLDDMLAALRETNPLRGLTYSERMAANAVLAALPEETGGVVVTSRIADQIGFTRSVVVSALRKLELAGLINTWSLGMKGTMIRLSPGITPEWLTRKIDDSTTSTVRPALTGGGRRG